MTRLAPRTKDTALQSFHGVRHLQPGNSTVSFGPSLWDEERGQSKFPGERHLSCLPIKGLLVCFDFRPGFANLSQFIMNPADSSSEWFVLREAFNTLGVVWVLHTGSMRAIRPLLTSLMKSSQHLPENHSHQHATKHVVSLCFSCFCLHVADWQAHRDEDHFT